MQDAVARLTPLGVVVLELLREDDMHPYEMIRPMRQRRDDRLVSLTNGTMYHTPSRACCGPGSSPRSAPIATATVPSARPTP